MVKGKTKARRFQYDKNRKRKHMKAKKGITIQCPQIKAQWDNHMSTEKNMLEMGLVSNISKGLRIPEPKELGVEEVSMDTLKEMREAANKKNKPTKAKVVDELESEANQPQERKLKVSGPEAEYAVYMMEKYGEDYKAMARDRRNYYQDTPKQIKRKIKTFKSIPAQYNAYLASKKSQNSETMETE